LTPGDLHLAADILREAREVVAFTGAGVSAESGISTFRDPDGFWQRFPPEEFATWQGLLKTAAAHPSRFAEFLLAFLEPIAGAEPNAAHKALADMERHVNVTVVTQNIDGLHQDAGTTTVKEIHGTLFELISVPGNRFVRLVTRDELRQVAKALRKAADGSIAAVAVSKAIAPIFGPGMGGFHRPNIILFGDAMSEPHWSQAVAAAEECDVMLTIGTSGMVQPAATLPLQAKAGGATVIHIDPTERGGDIWLQGSACEIMPQLLAETFRGERPRD